MECIRPVNPIYGRKTDRGRIGGCDYAFRAPAAFQANGVSSPARAAGQDPKRGSTSLRYSRMLIARRLQVSITDAIAATFGPALSAPMCNQLFPTTGQRTGSPAEMIGGELDWRNGEE